MTEQVFICDFSGFKFPISEAVRNWDGALVHRKFADKRNPQDFVTGRQERQPTITRPEAADTFLGTNDVTADSL